MHRNPKSPYYKPHPNQKTKNDGTRESKAKKDDNQVTGGKPDVGSKDGKTIDQPICTQCYIYGARNSYTLGKPIPNLSAIPDQHMSATGVDQKIFDQGSTVLFEQFDSLTTDEKHVELVGGEKPLDKKAYSVKLEGLQFGEAFHALICRLLLDRTEKQDRNDFQLHITYKDPAGDEDKIEWIKDFEALFAWYPIHPQSYNPNPEEEATSKEIATRIIAAAFRVPENKKPNNEFVFDIIRRSLGMMVHRKSDIRTSQYDGPQNKRTESKAIKTESEGEESFDERNTERERRKENPKTDARYWSPAYAAKFWLNRYFRLTEQFIKTRSKIDYDIRPEYTGMPKLYKVGLVAVIHVRRTPDSGSKIGRIMDHGNLMRVIDSIREVNKLTGKCGDKSCYRYFTHVIVCLANVSYLFLWDLVLTTAQLYGDFTYSEGRKMKEDIGLSAVERFQQAKKGKAQRDDNGGSYAQFPDSVPEKAYKGLFSEAMKETKQYITFKENAKVVDPPDFHVSFICRPWEAVSSDDKKSIEEERKAVERFNSVEKGVHELWENFRNFRVDRLPLQVKTLGIWTALQERYGDRICVIGHRSGFVEAAGFIGIPIFYLMDTELTGYHKSSFLFDARVYKGLKGGRLYEVADVMNTFIPINAFNIDLKAKSSTNENFFQIPDVKSPTGKALIAALFMYMCCRLRAKGRPAWTARVEMMHKKEGRKWLNERYEWATNQGGASPFYFTSETCLSE